MPERNDRALPGQGTLLAVVFVLLLVGATVFLVWWKMAARELAMPTGSAEGGSAATTMPAVIPESVTYYLPAGMQLRASTAPVVWQPDAQSRVREAVSVLFSGEHEGKGPVLSAVQLRELYIDMTGTAYLDLSVLLKEGIRSSMWEELLAVYAIVNTVTMNVPEVKQVRFLVDGKEAQALAGHIDLARTFSKRLDLVKRD